VAVAGAEVAVFVALIAVLLSALALIGFVFLSAGCIVVSGSAAEVAPWRRTVLIGACAWSVIVALTMAVSFLAVTALISTIVALALRIVISLASIVTGVAIVVSVINVVGVAITVSVVSIMGVAMFHVRLSHYGKSSRDLKE